MNYEIIEKLKREIEGFKDEVAREQVGAVIEVGDGIARISGLSKAVSQELLTIETEDGEVTALASNLEERSIGAIILGSAGSVRGGDRVRSSGKVLSIPCGEELIGRVLDPLGRHLDGKGAVFGNQESARYYNLERQAPSVLAREPVKTPLHTGIMAIDAMIPIGRGQRELIIGDRQTGKTSIAIDTILNQKQDTARQTPICIYVAIGQKESKTAKILKVLQDAGAMDYTIVISAAASSEAALQYLAPFAGCAVGEFFMDQGRDALVIYDDLSKHAQAYRQLSLLLRRPPGREAYPGDIFYLHARLLERAAKLNQEQGGGSLTALPIIETQLGDVSAYIPTNVISITDGQIYLDSNLFYQGLRPAIDVGLSVSRVGSSAQTKAMKQVAGKLRLELAQFRELQVFVQFSTDLDEKTKIRIARGRLLTEILKQPNQEPEPFERQVVILYAVLNGYIDTISRARISEFRRGLVDYIEKRHGQSIIGPLQKSGELTLKVEDNLKAALQEYKIIFGT